MFSFFSKISKLQHDDPFVLLKIIFIDAGYHQLAKLITIICLVFHLCSIFLEFNYLIQNFKTTLLLKYGCSINVMLYLISSAVYSMIQEMRITELINDLSTLWPIDYCGLQVKEKILKNSQQINSVYCYILVFFGIASIAMLPIWGDQKEWFFCVRVYEFYFGKWGKYPYYFYFFTYPWLAYCGFQIVFMMQYAVLQIRLQVYLINQLIKQISENHNKNVLMVKHDKDFQENIYEKFCTCISYHIVLKNWIKRFCAVVKTAMPFYVVSGTFTLIFILFQIVGNFQNLDLIIKLRVIAVSVCVIVIVFLFSVGGQLLITETNRIFDSLVNCSWYFWNIKNQRIYLIFMINTLNPISISVAGIVLDYKFGIAMSRICASYALMLYNLNNY